MMRRAAFVLLILGSLGVAAYAMVAYTAFPVGSLVHPQMKATYATHRAAILIHIFAASLALLLGPWQFIGVVRKRWPALHRWIGRVYLGVGVLLGGTAGLYMAVYSFGGPVSVSGFGLAALLWLYTGLRGYSVARSGDFGAHRAWMIRSFALAFAAVTLRAQLGTCFGVGLSFESFYPVLAWSCWVPNLLVAELLIRSDRSAPRTQPSLGKP